MKTSSDPRHKRRILRMQKLFASSFKPMNTETEVDKKIQNAAKEWPLSKIAKIDLAILRLAVTELLEAKVPPKVIIDEAVELGKQFGNENSAKFINGVLGTILESL